MIRYYFPCKHCDEVIEIKIKKGEELETNVPYLFECPFCGEENRASKEDMKGEK